MRKLLTGLIAAAALAGSAFTAAPASAGVYGDALSRCLVRATTPADKEALMLWIFSALSLNPAAQRYTTLTESQRTDISRRASQIMMRLVTLDCRPESIAVLRNEPESLEGAFRFLGQETARDLMGSAAVAAEMARLADFIDTDAMDDLMREASGTRTPTKAPI